MSNRASHWIEGSLDAIICFLLIICRIGKNSFRYERNYSAGFEANSIDKF